MGIGGGFTFSHELLHALQGRTGGRHEFVLADWRPAMELERALAPLAFVSLARGGIGRGLAYARRRLDAFRGEPSRHWIDARLQAAGIQVVCNLTPECLTTELPFLTVVWDLQHRLQPWFPEVSARGEWQRRERALGQLLPRAAYVIAGTEVGRREIERFYGVPAERILILPHPTPSFALEAGRAEGAPPRLPDEPPFLLYPAQLWPHKNHVNLLEAVRQLRDEHGLPYRLVLVGSDRGNAAHVRREIVARRLEDRVELKGFVSQAELIDLYRRARGLVYVSFFGPENLPPLEAFALGCPVIANRVSGAEEQLGDAALLVNAGRPEEIVAAVQRLEDPAQRDELARRGRARAARFTTTDFLAGVEDALDTLERAVICWRGSEWI